MMTNWEKERGHFKRDRKIIGNSSHSSTPLRTGNSKEIFAGVLALGSSPAPEPSNKNRPDQIRNINLNRTEDRALLDG